MNDANGVAPAPYRILVVDDEPDLELLVRQKFRKRIKEGELEFVFAHNGQEALDCLNADPTIDIVMSDINMPVMDGKETLVKIRNDQRLQSVPIFILSTSNDAKEVDTCRKLGATMWLVKPSSFWELVGYLRLVFSQSWL